jgi:hypothetical protein
MGQQSVPLTLLKRMLRAEKTSKNILQQSSTALPLHSQNNQGGFTPRKSQGKQFFKTQGQKRRKGRAAGNKRVAEG